MHAYLAQALVAGRMADLEREAARSRLAARFTGPRRLRTARGALVRRIAARTPRPGAVRTRTACCPA